MIAFACSPLAALNRSSSRSASSSGIAGRGRSSPGPIDRHCFVALTDGTIRDHHVVVEGGKRVMGGESVYRWARARGAMASPIATVRRAAHRHRQSRGNRSAFDGITCASGGKRLRIRRAGRGTRPPIAPDPPDRTVPRSTDAVWSRLA